MHISMTSQSHCLQWRKYCLLLPWYCEYVCACNTHPHTHTHRCASKHFTSHYFRWKGVPQLNGRGSRYTLLLPTDWMLTTTSHEWDVTWLIIRQIKSTSYSIYHIWYVATMLKRFANFHKLELSNFQGLSNISNWL